MVSGQGERERRAARSDQNGDGQDDREQYRTPGAGALDLRGRVPSLRRHGGDERGRSTGLQGVAGTCGGVAGTCGRDAGVSQVWARIVWVGLS
jgi:hypothetical protein